MSLISIEDLENIEIIDSTGSVVEFKTFYEARLKADKVAMFKELQLEIEEVPKYCMTHDATSVYRKAEDYISDINNLIQQKINELKGDKE